MNMNNEWSETNLMSDTYYKNAHRNNHGNQHDLKNHKFHVSTPEVVEFSYLQQQQQRGNK